MVGLRHGFDVVEIPGLRGEHASNWAYFDLQRLPGGQALMVLNALELLPSVLRGVGGLPILTIRKGFDLRFTSEVSRMVYFKVGRF